MIDFIVTIVLLLIIASIAIFGISVVMGAFTSYSFDALNGDSLILLLRMYKVLKYTRILVIISLFISIVVKSFQFIRAKKAEESRKLNQ